MLLNSLKERRKAAFTQNAQRMKRVLDNLQRKVDEVISLIAWFSRSFTTMFFIRKKKWVFKKMSSFHGFVKSEN